MTALVFVLAALGSWGLGLRLAAQVAVARGRTMAADGHYGLALAQLRRAAERPGGADALWRAIGDVAYEQALAAKVPAQARRSAETARQALQQALARNPLDAATAFALARAESLLETLFRRRHPAADPVPYDAAPYFRMALDLRPNGIAYHFARAAYLDRRGDEASLARAAGELAAIYPPAVEHLRRRPYWGAALVPAVIAGLERAVAEGRFTPQAVRHLAALQAGQGRWAEAARRQAELIRLEPSAGDGAYLLWGRYLWRGGDRAAAERAFLAGLDAAASPEPYLERLFEAYRRLADADAFAGFFRRMQARRPFSDTLQRAVARTLIQYERYPEAEAVLTPLTDGALAADAYALLAQIAERGDRLAEAEIYRHQAAVRAPRNREHRRAYIELLKARGKWPTVEDELDRLIGDIGSPPAELFAERAAVRRRRGDFAGALTDWETAIRLAPLRAAYHGQAAEMAERVGDLAGARRHYRRAVELAPREAAYRRRLADLGGR